ncbi:hypothetical protein F4777DRAFT_565466 [Nemania sp. FL0916]|nr:hypothetical protein F4777DRAFT_565466 [Nemania sp. FL0916]
MEFSHEPSEADVSSMQEIGGISRSEAVSRLKANNNNVDNAINELFDNPGSAKYSLCWDESHFNTDREGETNEAGISFNIQGADELPSASHVNSVAPTRPPSRANNPSPLGPANAAQEDADLARALAESAAESGVPSQEVGVIDHETTSKHFGPANRSEYDTEMWAMVPTKAAVDPGSTGPPPSARKRGEDAPAFLRPAKEHRLGALLTIYSAIPLARNALLRCGTPASTYGHNTEWWAGQAILRPEVLARAARGYDVWGDDARPDFTQELHRLMAFLDNSERSYASANGLAQTKEIDDPSSWATDYEDKLFQALKEAGVDSPNCGIEHMVTDCQVVPVIPPLSEQSDPDGRDEEDTTASFLFLDIALEYAYDRVTKLYDALDHLFWSSALSSRCDYPRDGKTVVLLKPAEVLTIRFGGEGLSQPCEIPAVFYADRYMNDRKELAIHFQTQIREIKDKLKQLAWSKEEWSNCTGQLCNFSLQGLDEKHDVRQCSSKMIEYVEGLIERQRRDAQWRHIQDEWQKSTVYSMDDLRIIHTWSGPFYLTEDEKANQERWEHIIELCRAQADEIGCELTDRTNQENELTQYLDVVCKRLTCQEDEVDDGLFVFRSNSDAYHPEYWNPSMKYLLRGVVPTTDIAYVCVRESDGSVNTTDVPKVKDQWWEFGYVNGDTSPVRTEKTTLQDVLSSVGTTKESRNSILIYATEAAINEEKIPLSDALRMFVKADSRSFQQELAQETNTHTTMAQAEDTWTQDQPGAAVTAAALSQIQQSSGPGKRKHSIGSSVATNGSIRSDLAEVDLTFDDTTTFDNVLDPSRQEADREKQTEDPSTTHGQDLETDAASATKMPEMSEREGRRTNPFLARPGSLAPNPVDVMELDTEHRHEDG